jgi:hypothetical protein
VYVWVETDCGLVDYVNDYAYTGGMVVVVLDGQAHELTGRLATIIRWLVERRLDIISGHKSITIECHGKVIKPTIAEHCEPLT